jgi:hypothetical protein
MPHEKTIVNYQGFDVILPKNMIAEKPYLWLQKNGRYYVEMGDTEKGVLIRVDNVLEGLEAHLSKLGESLTELYSKQESIKKELSKKEDYATKIEETKAKLARIDKQLGV